MKTYRHLVARPLTLDSLSFVQDLLISCRISSTHRQEFNCYLQSYQSMLENYPLASDRLKVYLVDVNPTFDGKVVFSIASESLSARTSALKGQGFVSEIQFEIAVALDSGRNALSKLRDKVVKNLYLVELEHETLLETVESK